ncbi:MAG: hypothetical protein LWW85_11170 [Marinilabiliales bacterium]|nr:hypothetical protein [Marinilabiliales bacterium]
MKRVTDDLAGRFGINKRLAAISVKTFKRSKLQLVLEAEEKMDIITKSDYSKIGLENLKHFYRIFHQEISFFYQNELLRHAIHPLIQQWEVAEPVNLPVEFALFSDEAGVTFQKNKQFVGQWGHPHLDQMKGSVFFELLNVLYNKGSDDWLMTMHAAAVTLGNKAVCFSAHAGGGKTTLSTLMQLAGYQLVSDDFVAFGYPDPLIHTFPVAMSIKQGAWQMLERTAPVGSLSFQERYFSQEKGTFVYHEPLHQASLQRLYPSSDVVFVKYDKDVPFRWKQLSRANGLRELLPQVWLSPGPDKAEKFMEWVSKTRFYALTYHDNERAIEAIQRLFT